MKEDYGQMLFSIPIEKVWEKMRELLHTELSNLLGSQVTYQVQGLHQKPVYKAAEVCKMFGITRQTLHLWNKERILIPHKIKSRVYYLWTDLEKLIKEQSI